MIGLALLREAIADLDPSEVEEWIARRWVRPEETEHGYEFEEIDVARIRLIRSLRHELQLDTAVLPVVLSLLDQLHAARRQLQVMRARMEG